MEVLLAQAELKMIEAMYVTKTPEETEFAASWAQLPPGLQAGEALSLVAPEHKRRATLVPVRP